MLIVTVDARTPSRRNSANSSFRPLFRIANFRSGSAVTVGDRVKLPLDRNAKGIETSVVRHK